MSPLEKLCFTSLGKDLFEIKKMLDNGELTDLAIEYLISGGNEQLLNMVKKYVKRTFIIKAHMLKYIKNVYILDFMTDYCIFSPDLYTEFYQTLIDQPKNYDLWLVEIKMTPVIPGDIQTYVKLAERVKLFCDIAESNDDCVHFEFEFVKVIMDTDQDLLDIIYSSDYSYPFRNRKETNPYFWTDFKKEIQQIQKSIIPWYEINEKMTANVPDADQRHPTYYGYD